MNDISYLRSQWRELNPWPLPYQGNALPLSYIGKKKERETGFKPATLSLEGWRSINWATLALYIKWGEQDSNLWRRSQQIYSLPSLTAWVSPRNKQEPIEGLEPTTCWLQISCSSQLSYIGLYWSNKIQERSPLTTLEGCKFIKVFRIGTKK